jgi:hypothetical protein
MLFRSAIALLAALPALAADADREVALWALRMGGAVTLEGNARPIRDVAALPDSDFRIVVLNLIGVNMHPPHMEAFGKLTALRELHFRDRCGIHARSRGRITTIVRRTLLG